MRPFSNTPLGQALISNRNLTMDSGYAFKSWHLDDASVYPHEYVVQRRSRSSAMTGDAT